MTKRYYCCYFDHRYLPRGIVMMRSIRAFNPNSHFFILALDEKCERLLNELGSDAVTVIPLRELEAADPELAAVKAKRTLIEYYFTCSPCFPNYVFARHGRDIAMLTYVDSDTLFFADPEIVFEEVGDASVAITPHRFSPERAGLVRYGRFNVGWISWRNDAVGRRCLADYRADCLAWCYDRIDGDRYADQKYLDQWPLRYPGRVKELDHPGVNAAAWNVNNHVLSEVDGVFLLDDRRLVFWHYHGLKELEGGAWTHSLDESTRARHPMLLDRIYKGYALQLVTTEQALCERFGFSRDLSTHIRYSANRPSAAEEAAVNAAPASSAPAGVPAMSPPTAPPQGGWVYAGTDWPAGVAPGWDDAALRQVRRQQWAGLQATADADILGVTAPEQLNVLVALDAVWTTRQLTTRPRVLDWGGDIGAFHHRLSRSIPGLAVDYTVKEVPPLCALGRELNPEVRFIEDDAAALAERYDLTIASASLHYDEDWRGVLRRVAAATEHRFLLARQPTVSKAPTHIARQGAYGAVFTCWVINEDELRAAFDAIGWRTVRRVMSGDAAQVAGAPEQPVFRSYLLAPIG